MVPRRSIAKEAGSKKFRLAFPAGIVVAGEASSITATYPDHSVHRHYRLDARLRNDVRWLIFERIEVPGRFRTPILKVLRIALKASDRVHALAKRYTD